MGKEATELFSLGCRRLSAVCPVAGLRIKGAGLIAVVEANVGSQRKLEGTLCREAFGPQTCGDCQLVQLSTASLLVS